YHYHVAPVHLEKVVGKGKPIAYALDGYPVYGSTEPDGSPVKPLDPLGGHEDGTGGYHYHALKRYPHLIGGFRGEVVERDGQVDPQPRARGVRQALPPLSGATIVAFESPAADTRRLVYEIDGRKGSVAYTMKPDGGATFTYTDPAGRMRTESYAADSRRPGGGPGGGQGGGPTDGQRPRPPAPRPGERPPRGGPEVRPRAAQPKQERRGLVVSSPAIGPDGRLPREYTCDGAGISPPLDWQPGPDGTRSYAVVLWHEAPDRLKSYWVVHGIPATAQGLPKGARNIGTTGQNDKRRAEYDPPCSKGPGAKTYHGPVYALSAEPAVPPGGADRAALLAAIRDITLAEGTLTITYDRDAAR
ncbi:MAG: phosphatidylethanolamine-binding protein, partial [Planctomycetia bacterium]